ncbi:MAG: hypothetical protein CME64_03560 [Halobacteriovoraceae bacterium]|nr:hypothetical protein [Halobacteriovoraceae bacterium]|tara:strand:- start:15743 stop:16306 length:564 start_codon:yes stop_codon:yes gene_type:complete
MKKLLIGLTFLTSISSFAEVTQILNRDYNGQRVYISTGEEDISFKGFEDYIVLGNTDQVSSVVGPFFDYVKSVASIPQGYRAVELYLTLKDGVSETIVIKEEGLWGLIPEQSYTKHKLGEYKRSVYLIKDHYNLDLLGNDNFEIRSVEFDSKVKEVYSDRYGNVKRVATISKLVLVDENNIEYVIEE